LSDNLFVTGDSIVAKMVPRATMRKSQYQAESAIGLKAIGPKAIGPKAIGKLLTPSPRFAIIANTSVELRLRIELT
jgi:hypothetical protein